MNPKSECACKCIKETETAQIRYSPTGQAQFKCGLQWPRLWEFKCALLSPFNPTLQPKQPLTHKEMKT